MCERKSFGRIAIGRDGTVQPSLYSVLGIRRNLTRASSKAAWRLARDVHVGVNTVMYGEMQFSAWRRFIVLFKGLGRGSSGYIL